MDIARDRQGRLCLHTGTKRNENVGDCPMRAPLRGLDAEQDAHGKLLMLRSSIGRGVGRESATRVGLFSELTGNEE